MSEYRWSQKSLDELREFHWDTINPQMMRDGLDPDEPPSYQWLADKGWSGLAYTLREHHDLTVKEFFTDVVGLEDGRDSDTYEWGIDDCDTIEAFDAYLSMLDRRRGLADSTLPTRQTHLARFARVYRDLHGRADLLDRLDDRDSEPEEIDRCLRVLDEFDRELSTDGTKLKYLQTVRSFYEYLVDFRRAVYNPVANAAKQFRWEQGTPDNRTMTADQIRAMYEAASSLEDELLVLGLASWGLRPGELASMHASQLVLDVEEDTEPYIAFDERKNGPGTVALLYGVDELYHRIDHLDERPSWNGYIFPSSQSTSGHLTTDTINNRFKRLARACDVRVDGSVPTAKLCRRFWYTTYQSAVGELLTQLEGVAEDQGSSSATVVMSNYLSEEKRRQFRREAMRESLAEIFE
ncbi:XerC/D-like integrase [Haloferax elongans ATCC BAA-1513]|uniref:XerC/D-like integrase n=1 Tax=Haloferax elongans ATCC BAA-1513 TaxID=1230453 RepID=M0I2B4_HALEO|nr:XerC/D-like integrase [Haloferax elongans]ELZ89514.1 XerC/D-like integrase [Haloferax elongans ATCC BAA-1513]